MGKAKRQSKRHIRRLRTQFFADGFPPRQGFSSDLSADGLFIRTNHALGRGSFVEMRIHLPDGTVCNMQGTVMRSVKTSTPQLIKNGMGVKLHAADPCYVDFVRELSGDGDGQQGRTEADSSSGYASSSSYTPPPLPQTHVILACTSCGAKNKIPRDKLHMGPKCGRCKSPLRT